VQGMLDFKDGSARGWYELKDTDWRAATWIEFRPLVALDNFLEGAYRLHIGDFHRADLANAQHPA
jgi:hypothetical protein